MEHMIIDDAEIRELAEKVEYNEKAFVPVPKSKNLSRLPVKDTPATTKNLVLRFYEKHNLALATWREEHGWILVGAPGRLGKPLPLGAPHILTIGHGKVQIQEDRILILIILSKKERAGEVASALAVEQAQPLAEHVLDEEIGVAVVVKGPGFLCVECDEVTVIRVMHETRPLPDRADGEVQGSVQDT